MTRHDVWATYLDEPTGRDVADDERAALDRIRAVLADPDTWSEPPAGLTARVLELAAADLDTTTDAHEGDTTVAATDVRPAPERAGRTGRAVVGGRAADGAERHRQATRDGTGGRANAGARR